MPCLNDDEREYDLMRSVCLPPFNARLQLYRVHVGLRWRQEHKIGLPYSDSLTRAARPLLSLSSKPIPLPTPYTSFSCSRRKLPLIPLPVFFRVASSASFCAASSASICANRTCREASMEDASCVMAARRAARSAVAVSLEVETLGVVVFDCWRGGGMREKDGRSGSLESLRGGERRWSSGEHS